MSIRAAASKIPLATAHLSARPSAAFVAPLSTTAQQSLENLKGVLEEYRQVHYRQCLPSRFKKDLVRVIASDGIETLLKNIGAEERVSRTEIDSILSETGGDLEKTTLPANKMMHLI